MPADDPPAEHVPQIVLSVLGRAVGMSAAEAGKLLQEAAGGGGIGGGGGERRRWLAAGLDLARPLTLASVCGTPNRQISFSLPPRFELWDVPAL